MPITADAPRLPNTVVAAFVFICEAEKILLVKQGHGQQFWSLPGGVMEEGEAPLHQKKIN